jgi:hypothetical protein
MRIRIRIWILILFDVDPDPVCPPDADADPDPGSQIDEDSSSQVFFAYYLRATILQESNFSYSFFMLMKGSESGLLVLKCDPNYNT